MSAFRIVTEDERLARPRRIKGVVIGLEAPGAEASPERFVRPQPAAT